MKNYTVTFAASAKTDIFQSFEWGCRVWGKHQAQRWARDLRSAIQQQLKHFPTGLPLAPENENSTDEIRQLIVGRYRVLFTIQGKKVHVLHVRGAYTRDVDQNGDEE
jgi:plasmid stabilization system protein ParE